MVQVEWLCLRLDLKHQLKGISRPTKMYIRNIDMIKLRE